MRTFKFVKEPGNLWYIELPEWTGEKADLQMVSGADTFLDILAQGESEVHLVLSEEPFEGAEFLEMISLGRLEGWEIGSGAWYNLIDYQGIEYNHPMWLCDVTKFVFGDFPEIIYFIKTS